MAVDWTEIAAIATGFAALVTACAAGATLWVAHRLASSLAVIASLLCSYPPRIAGGILSQAASAIRPTLDP